MSAANDIVGNIPEPSLPQWPGSTGRRRVCPGFRTKPGMTETAAPNTTGIRTWPHPRALIPAKAGIHACSRSGSCKPTHTQFEASEMNKTIIAILATAITGTAAVSLIASEDHGEREHEEHENRRGFFSLPTSDDDHAMPNSASYRADPRHALYEAECGSCHMAYPPTLLPAVSWQAMMATLDDHFGENAELDLETRAQIENYLGENDAGSGEGGDYAVRMWRATRGRTAPMRITATDYFLGKHHELSRKMVEDNPKVKSFSRCEACHGRAADGSFAEDEVRIPGYGRWDD